MIVTSVQLFFLSVINISHSFSIQTRLVVFRGQSVHSSLRCHLVFNLEVDFQEHLDYKYKGLLQVLTVLLALVLVIIQLQRQHLLL